MLEKKQNIIKHIKRLQGQLNAVLKELEKENPDCEAGSNTLFAAARSFATLRMEFISCFLEEDFINQNKTKSKKLKNLLNLIKG